MKILFLNPNWSSIPPRNFLGCRRPHHPLELLYPATILSEDHDVLVIDAFLERLSDRDLKERLASFNPEVVVMTTAPSYLFWRCCPLDISLPNRISSLIRLNSHAILIIIGPHPTVSPHWVMDECQPDYIIRGEAENSIADFINSNLFDKGVQGLYSNDVNNGIAVIEDLNSLPKIDYNLAPIGNYHSHFNKFKKGASVEFSRGCIFQCTFCFKQFFRNKYRIRSSKKVIDEIKELKNLGYQYVYFIDELFGYDSVHLRELLEGLKDIKIGWGCQCRPDIMTPGLIQLMKEAGCRNIEYGLESLDKDISQTMKMGMNYEKSLKCVNHTAKIGINTSIFFLFGVPGETVRSLKKNEDITANLDKSISLASGILVPYPTTSIFEELAGKKELIGEGEWKRCIDLIGRISDMHTTDLEKTIILSNINAILRNTRLPVALNWFITGLAEVIPASIYRSILEFLLVIRKYNIR